MAAAAIARLADGPGGANGRKHSGPPPHAQNLRPKHRVALAAEAASAEAMVLASIVVEGDGKMRDNEPRGWHPSTAAPAAGDAVHRGWWGSREEQGSPRPDGMGEDLQAGGGKGHEEMRRRCLDRLEAAAGLGFDELRRRHVEDVEALLDRVHFSLEPSTDGSSSSSSGTTEGGELGDSPSGSCVAGLPIRTRVSRSGKTCTERGGEGPNPTDGVAGSGGPDGRTVVDDGLIGLMYHYGRLVGCFCDVAFVAASGTKGGAFLAILASPMGWIRCGMGDNFLSALSPAISRPDAHLPLSVQARAQHQPRILRCRVLLPVQTLRFKNATLVTVPGSRYYDSLALAACTVCTLPKIQQCTYDMSRARNNCHGHNHSCHIYPKQRASCEGI